MSFTCQQRHDATVAWIEEHFKSMTPVRRHKSPHVGTVFGLTSVVDDPNVFQLQIEYVSDNGLYYSEFIDMYHIDAVWRDEKDPNITVFSIKGEFKNDYCEVL